MTIRLRKGRKSGTLLSFILNVSSWLPCTAVMLNRKLGWSLPVRQTPALLSRKSHEIIRMCQAKPTLSSLRKPATELWVSEIVIVWMHRARSRSRRVWDHFLVLALQKCCMYIEVVLNITKSGRFLERSGQKADLPVMAL